MSKLGFIKQPLLRKILHKNSLKQPITNDILDILIIRKLNPNSKTKIPYGI